MEGVKPRKGRRKGSNRAQWDDGTKARLLTTSGRQRSATGGMKTLVATSTGRSVGFVPDANGAVADRWRAVRNQLEDFELELPGEIAEDIAAVV